MVFYGLSIQTCVLHAATSPNLFRLGCDLSLSALSTWLNACDTESSYLIYIQSIFALQPSVCFDFCSVYSLSNWLSSSAAWVLYSQASRAISIGQLHTSLHFHIQPINVVVFNGSLVCIAHGKSYLEVGFPLRCFQRLSLPNIATRRCHWRDNRYTRGSSTLVLSY